MPPYHAIPARVVLTALVAAACAPDAASRAFTVQDSAGIQIALSTQPAWAAADAWRVSEEPTLQIGVVDGDSAYQFYQLIGAAQLSDGRIAVTDIGSNQLRYYDASGRFIAASGGAGSGPGEFQRIGKLQHLAADSLVVFDMNLRRVSAVSPSGDIVVAANLEQPGAAPLAAVLRLSDGRYVVTTGWSSAQMRPPFAAGLYRLDTPVLLFAADGTLEDTVGMFPGYEISITTDGDRTGFGMPPFGRYLSAAIRDDLVYVGTGDAREVRVYSPDGALVRIMRAPTTELTFKSADRDAYRDELLSMLETDAQRAAAEARLAAMEMPATKAAFGGVVVDVDGNTWLSPPRLLSTSVGDWMVFDPQGRWLGAVAIPPDLRVLDIGHDYILARWMDELQVEYLRRYQLIK